MAEVAGITIAAIQIAAQTTQTCLKYIRDVRNAGKDVEKLRQQLEIIDAILKRVEKFCQETPSDKDSLEKIRKLAENCQHDLLAICDRFSMENKRKIRFFSPKLRWPFESKDIEKIVVELGRYQQHLTLAITTNIAANVEHIRTHLEKLRIPDLPIAAGASFDSHSNELLSQCHEGTRIEVLQDIEDWIQDPLQPCLLWLNGMAGAGKTTISRTVALVSKTANRLGANFFFRRGEDDRGKASKLVTTLSTQLMEHLPEIIPAIQEVLDKDTRLPEKELADQFDKLILKPLGQIQQQPLRTVVLVIDALDECDVEGHASLVLRLLSKLETVTSVKIKVFVTSCL